MDYLGILGGIAGVFLLACLSPGPVWFVITSTSIGVSRKAGVLTGIGVAGATLTWAVIAMLGFGVLTQLLWLATAIKLTGAAYLTWIGIRMIVGSRRPPHATLSLSASPSGAWATLRRGYLTSITNPKAAAFFSSIFVVMLPDHAPTWVYAAAVMLLSLLSAAWHCGLAVVFSTAPVQHGYRRVKSKIDAAVGVILVALGVRLALSR